MFREIDVQWIWHQPSIWQEPAWGYFSLSPSSWNLLLEPNQRLHKKTSKGRAEHLVSQPEVAPHGKYGFIDQCSKHLCFGCQQPLPLFLGRMHYPLSGFSPCCFCGASPIPSCKVETWFRPKPLRIITIFHPRDWFRYVHAALLETARPCWNGWQ